uniref:Agenet domain-containing protein n=1 Tax=Brassica oleracea var. oleracea TaxID=109376 RepID=A0A0D3CFS1_BRAOL
MKLSGKTVYGILTRSIVTVKKNEAWFHFAGQPMKFSIREFHMVTGLKCNGDVEGPRGEYEWDLLKGRTHKLSDVLNQLKKTRVDASDERVCLAMLLLVESILLPKNNKGTFPLEYVNKAKDMMYPWGRDAYLVLLRSIQKAVANHLEDTSKFELQGYPLVFHLWILASIPVLRDKFSNWAPTVDVPGPIYLCEKYTELENPSLERVLQIEAHKKASFYSDLLKVTCILPPIPHDPEDDVSMEDEHSDKLESVKDISKKGYKFKPMIGKIANPDQTASRQNEANLDQTQQDTKEPMNETISQKISDTQRLTRARAKILREQNKNEEPRVQTHFDVGANVEIASKGEDIYVKWYPGIVLKTDIRNGVGMLKVEYSTRFCDKEKKTKKLQESVSIHSIRPQPPPGDTKGFELMDKVEAYHNDGWCSGEVHIILSNDIYSVRFNSSIEFIKFNLSDLRILKEWVDGVWKMEKEIEVHQTQSVKPRQDDHAKKGKPVVGMKRKATAQPVDRLAFLQREEKRRIVPRNPPMPVTPKIILPIDPFVTPEFPLFSRLGYWMQLCGIHYV